MRSRILTLAVVGSSLLGASLTMALPAQAATPRSSSSTSAASPNILPGGGGGSCYLEAEANSPTFPVNEGDVTIHADSCGYPIRAKIECGDGSFFYSGSHTAEGTYKVYCDSPVGDTDVVDYGWQYKVSGATSWTTGDWEAK